LEDKIKNKSTYPLRAHEERPLHNFDMRTVLIILDLAASSNGSDWRALLKQYLASSKRPSATKTRPSVLNAGAYPGCSSSDFVHIAFAR